ncbi:MAG TPA: hypothetical protein VJM34_09370 [Novosphingobium sp.]|uniref:hypothetical protein n=1 Tax=Rhizorhapis sp. TaxID=1968842 RepID=UPI002B491039|nr:hypothetical protein [Rhizorhapis sp.]HKR16888.1 hypothetical protein [Rhizorhapis sp.]HKX78715.1 hypothetical protein [Novosphingobium sp.]
MHYPETAAPVERAVIPALAGEEHFRLVTGFADLFTAVVLAIGLITMGGLAGASLGALAGVTMAALTWWLSRPLVERRNLAACAIVLTFGFVAGVQVTLAPTLGILGSLLGAAATWFYWRRFRIPAAAAASILTLVLLAGGSSTNLFSFTPFQSYRSASGMALLWGLVVFGIAMAWDISDRLRQTRRADVAFWLHLAAAPLVVHGAFAILHDGLGYGPADSPLPILLLFLILAIMALIVDRRPILVSSILYVAYALYSLVATKDEPLKSVAIVALLLGGGILLLSVAWNHLRRWLLAIAPAALSRRVVPTAVISNPPVPRPDTPASETEPLRLVFSFNDIFVAMGLSTLIAGSCLISLRLFVMPGAAAPRSDFSFLSILDWRLLVLPTVTSWGAAEYFVRRRRMALPALQLASSFSFIAGYAGIIIFWHLAGGEQARFLQPGFWQQPQLVSHMLPILLLASLCGAVANLLFAWRHRIALSYAYAFQALLLPILYTPLTALIAVGGGENRGAMLTLLQERAILAGAITFAVAMLLDRSDSERRTLRCDIAFWLHMSASLMILPALFSLIGSLANASWIIGALFITLVLLAIAIDRRAAILVSMPFVIHSFPATGHIIATATLFLCGVLLVTTLYWEKLRALILSPFARAA